MLKRRDAILVFIDVQGKLHEIMHDKDVLDRNLERLIQCSKLLDVPVIATEQLPEKLGKTSKPFRDALKEGPQIDKTAFSCCGEPRFEEAFLRLNKHQVILVGIEAHVCVYQTAIDFLEQGVEVFVAADAVSSRCPENKALALQALRDAGAVVLPTESILFALLRDAADPRFKNLLKLIK